MTDSAWSGGGPRRGAGRELRGGGWRGECALYTDAGLPYTDMGLPPYNDPGPPPYTDPVAPPYIEAPPYTDPPYPDPNIGLGPSLYTRPPAAGRRPGAVYPVSESEGIAR